MHGIKGSKSLEGTDIPPEILIAISKHEVAYTFSKINTSIYEEHFVKPGYSDEQQKLILVASYVDTVASLRTDGKPDLTNFNFLIKSRENYLLIKKFLERGVPYDERALNVLKKQDRVFTEADLEKLVVREERCRCRHFNRKARGTGGLRRDHRRGKRIHYFVGRNRAKRDRKEIRSKDEISQTYSRKRERIINSHMSTFDNPRQEPAGEETRERIGAIKEQVAANAERVAKLGEWPPYIEPGSLVERIPKEDGGRGSGF